MPELQLAGVMQRIRSGSDPFSVLNFILHGDPHQSLGTSSDTADSKRLRFLDTAALRDSVIRVPARPWTLIAGDGIVSHLISIFLDREQTGLGLYMDRRVFVADMVAGDVLKAVNCSPVLVNAMCAYSAVSSFLRCLTNSDM